MRNACMGSSLEAPLAGSHTANSATAEKGERRKEEGLRIPGPDAEQEAGDGRVSPKAVAMPTTTQTSARLVRIIQPIRAMMPQILRRRFRDVLFRTHIVFRIRNAHKPFIKPAHDVIEALDAMPRLS